MPLNDFGNFDAPLVVGTAFGFRAFTMDTHGNVHSPSRIDYVWESGENTAACDFYNRSRVAPAYCNFMSFSGHPSVRVPNPNCSCGFYSFFTPDQGGRYYGQSSSWSVFGIVEAYGTTIIGSKGMRSSKARIRAIIVPSKEDYTYAYRPPVPSAINRARVLYPNTQFFDADQMFSLRRWRIRRDRFDLALRAFPLSSAKEFASV